MTALVYLASDDWMVSQKYQPIKVKMCASYNSKFTWLELHLVNVRSTIIKDPSEDTNIHKTTTDLLHDRVYSK